VNETPNKEALRADLERARDEFHQLLAQLDQRDWFYRDLTVSDFSIGELMAHMRRSLTLVPNEVAVARSGRSLRHLPRWLYNPLRLLGARYFAWRSSPQAIAAEYDEAHEAALAALAAVDDDEWERIGRFYDLGARTIADIFRHQPRHVAEHAATVRRLLASKRERIYGYY
jgi:hypothetical protein